MQNTVIFRVIGLASLGLAAACSAPDPGEITIRRPAKPQPTRFDAGVSTVGTGGGGAGAFAGAPPYLRQSGPSTLQQAHATTVIGGTNPAGRDCTECHKVGGLAERKDGGASTLWTAGGTVYTSLSGPPVDGGIEVRIRLPDGGGASAYTDDQGNFFFPQTLLPSVPGGSLVGVRGDLAPTGRSMSGILLDNQGGCSGTGTCHGGTANKVFMQ